MGDEVPEKNNSEIPDRWYKGIPIILRALGYVRGIFLILAISMIYFSLNQSLPFVKYALTGVVLFFTLIIFASAIPTIFSGETHGPSSPSLPKRVQLMAWSGFNDVDIKSKYEKLTKEST